MNPARRLCIGLLACALPAAAQERPDPAALLSAQREAMAAFAFMDGVWRGTATTVRPSGDKHVITQTERIGPLLDGAVKVIEGRGGINSPVTVVLPGLLTYYYWFAH